MSRMPAGCSRRRPLRRAVRWLTASNGRAFTVVFALSFVLRAAFLAVVPTEYFLPDSGWEVGAVAQSLATTGQFANPYSIPTGYTAHPAPIYPAILGVIYRVFGVTLAAGYASWIFTITSVSALYGLLPWLAGRFGLPRTAGVIGGTAGALLPQWPAAVESLAAIVLSLLLWRFLCRWTFGCATRLGSILFGVAAGIALHLQPALLAVLLGCLAFELWWNRENPGRWRTLLLIAGVIVACVPWAWRNYERFHEGFFIRSNFGLELRLANFEGATVERTTHRHPRISVKEAKRVRDLGELEYMRQARNEAVQWIRSHPATFFWLSARRFAYFWCGPLDRPSTAPTVALTLLAIVGAWRVLPRLASAQRAVFLIPLSTYPIVYYLTCYIARYRLPVEWILLLLAGAALIRGQIPDASRDRREIQLEA